MFWHECSALNSLSAEEEVKHAIRMLAHAAR